MGLICAIERNNIQLIRELELLKLRNVVTLNRSRNWTKVHTHACDDRVFVGLQNDRRSWHCGVVLDLQRWKRCCCGIVLLDCQR